MKFVMSWMVTMVCLAVLALLSSACQFIAPAAATPTAAATDTPAPAVDAYPQPYPLAPTFDPYLPPPILYPYAYPVESAPLVPGSATVLYPGVLDGAEVYWVQAISMILNGEVTQVMQTHDLQVYLTLKDGRTLLAIEPEIDEVMKVIESCGDPCKNILVATE